MKTVFSTLYKGNKQAVLECIANFETTGKRFDERKRNSLKLFEVDGDTINVKSFKVPNLINKVAYSLLRDSKAQRSYEYAHILLEKGILTPQPIAYLEEKGLLFGQSFYVSKHLKYDLTYRDLCKESPYLGNVEILKAFTAFTYGLHQKEINFLDHSLGNTLIVIKEDGYDFYLVDLNRMTFGPMDFKARMHNFARLSPREKDISVMAEEYARLSGEAYENVFETMFNEIATFQDAFYKKKRLKKRIKFWKK